MKSSRILRMACTCVILAGVCGPGMQVAAAADIGAAISASVGRSDNILRTENNPIEETMTTVGVELDIDQTWSQTTIDLFANADYISYKDDSFDNDLVGGATLFASYEFIEDVFDWNLQYNFGQQVFDPLAPIRPDNRENVSYLTTGPDLDLELGNRFFVKAGANYSTTNYEISPNENVRKGGRISFGRMLSSSRRLSLVGTQENVDNDVDATTPDYDRRSLFLRFESFNSRGSFTVDFGVNELELDGSNQENDGTLFRIDWVRDLANGMEVTLGAGSRYSDQGDLFRFLQDVSFDPSGTEDVVGTAVPFRNNFGLATFTLDRSRTSIDIVALFSDEDYEGRSDLDRKSTQLNFAITREFTRKVFGELAADTSKREFSLLDRDDRDVQYTAALGYNITEAFSATLSYQHFERSSDQDVTEFDEDRVFLRFSYVPRWSRQ